ncbi:MAG: SDR family oxidoreductase [Saprospiraceae bacterium]
MEDFTGKKVLITGGSRGIGQATAMAFAKRGAQIALNFHNDNQAASDTIDLLEGEGHLAIKADISRPAQVEQLVDAVLGEFGQIDILVNNAGIYLSHPIDDCDYETWQKAWQDTLGLNLSGVANMCYCVAQRMMAKGGGHIINVSSRGAFRGEPAHPAYGASKAGLNAMSQSLAQALGKYKIYVSVVAPGFVETDMTREILDGPEGDNIKAQSPLQRVASPEEVAHGIVFLASQQSAFMTGAILDINGASYLRS